MRGKALAGCEAWGEWRACLCKLQKPKEVAHSLLATVCSRFLYSHNQRYWIWCHVTWLTFLKGNIQAQKWNPCYIDFNSRNKLNCKIAISITCHRLFVMFWDTTSDFFCNWEYQSVGVCSDGNHSCQITNEWSSFFFFWKARRTLCELKPKSSLVSFNLIGWFCFQQRKHDADILAFYFGKRGYIRTHKASEKKVFNEVNVILMFSVLLFSI